MASLSGIHTEITLDGRRVNRCPECIVTASRRAVLTQAFLTIPDPAGDVEKALKVGQVVSISYGYRGKPPGSFKGTVTGWEPSAKARDQVVIRSGGPELPLLMHRMTEAWFEEPAAVLARRILAASGLSLGEIALPDVVIPRMTLSGVTLREAMVQLVYSVETGFAHKLNRFSLRMERENLVLNGAHVDGPHPVIATAGGLIRNKTGDGHGRSKELETFLIPFMRPGMRFTLRDKRRGMDAVFEADGVTHAIRPRSVRTYILYGGNYERFQC